MKLSFRMISKFALGLVVLGYFMPVACSMNGFGIASVLMQTNAFMGLLMYVMFFAACAGVGLGVVLLLKKQPPVLFDWIAIGVCMISGLIVYFGNSNVSLQIGGILIIIGWLGSLGTQIYSKLKES
ncbi:MAG: hypothetical protein LBC80_07305 [Treponema sp.]|jgi:hypothetical protein|nr:hypothetical protein [Treponema sp.]